MTAVDLLLLLCLSGNDLTRDMKTGSFYVGSPRSSFITTRIPDLSKCAISRRCAPSVPKPKRLIWGTTFVVASEKERPSFQPLWPTLSGHCRAIQGLLQGQVTHW